MRPSEVILSAVTLLDAKPKLVDFFCNFIRDELLLPTPKERQAACLAIEEAIWVESGYCFSTWAMLAEQQGWLRAYQTRTLSRGPGTPYFKRRREWLLELAAELHRKELVASGEFMFVEIDGKQDVRRIVAIEAVGSREDVLRGFGPSFSMPRLVPQTNDDERVQHTIDGKCHIIKVKS